MNSTSTRGIFGALKKMLPKKERVPFHELKNEALVELLSKIGCSAQGVRLVKSLQLNGASLCHVNSNLLMQEGFSAFDASRLLTVVETETASDQNIDEIHLQEATLKAFEALKKRFNFVFSVLVSSVSLNAYCYRDVLITLMQ